MSFLASVLEVAVPAAVAGALLYFLNKRTAAAKALPPVHDHEDIDPADPFTGVTMHLQVGYGDVAPRILSVGDVGRASRIARFLDHAGSATHPGAPKHIKAGRGFETHTGTYKGVPVSIIATLMGIPNMDFVVREARRVTTGPMAMLRYGTCGGLGTTKMGTVVITTEGCIGIRRDSDAVGKLLAAGAKTEADVAALTNPRSDASKAIGAEKGVPAPYVVSDVIPGDDKLSQLYLEKMRSRLTEAFGDKYPVVGGIGASADSFYSSQARPSAFFYDFNRGLIEAIETLPRLLEPATGTSRVKCLEMETSHLLDLARCSTDLGRIHAAGGSIVVWNRHEQVAITEADLQKLEQEGGQAALDALIAFPL